MLLHTDLISLLSYDPDTGELTWLPRAGISRADKIFNTRFAGKRAGSQCPRGYRYIKIHQKFYSESRLVWFYVTGNLPADEVDHRDTNPSNNRFANLREANRSQNGANRSLHKNSVSGVKGVSRHHSGKWVAQAGSRKLGTLTRSMHHSIEEAAEAYRSMVGRLYGEFARAA